MKKYPRVYGFDCSKPPLTAPPSEITRIGFHCWCEWDEEEEVLHRWLVEYFVLPDGSALIRRDIPAVATGEVEPEELIPPGQWGVYFPTKSTHFGCWGGQGIRNIG